MYDSFDNTYQATIGIDFLSKTMYLEDRTNASNRPDAVCVRFLASLNTSISTLLSRLDLRLNKIVQ
uniref:Uncharacterized protein n=1 Tax=Parascaris equorum TaxID=6256 RepID=A0A914R3X5_PAREQ